MSRLGIKLFFLLLTVAVMTGCQQGGNQEEETRVPVEVVEIKLGDVTQSLNYNGDIKAELDVKVFSKIPDRIEKFYADEGETIQAGDPIAKILATQIEQGVRQAEAGLASAEAQAANMKSEYERALRLNNQDAMSQQQFDAVLAQYEAVSAQLKQSKAAVVSAKSMFKDATISAPISGIIGKRYLEAGDMAAPSIPVVSVVQMDRIKIELEATEQDLGRLSIGQKAEVRVRSYPDEVFLGKVYKISPVLDPMTRMATVEVILSNPAHRLKPGMFAEVVVITGTLKDVLVVPRYAVIESTSLKAINGKDAVVKNYFVYVVNDSARAEQRQLDVGYVNHRLIAVEEGVANGEKLVVAGQNNLRDGMRVFIPDSTPAAEEGE